MSQFKPLPLPLSRAMAISYPLLYVCVAIADAWFIRELIFNPDMSFKDLLLAAISLFYSAYIFLTYLPKLPTTVKSMWDGTYHI